MAKKKETKDAEGFIEIPFGAFDSETMGWTYTIPEGFIAKIEDGKIIVEKAESEDEKMRKMLIELVKNCGELNFTNVTREATLAYLEKQKEPLTPEEKMNHRLYLEGFDVGKKVGETLKEQQPAEWSEEDEKHINSILARLEGMCKNGATFTSTRFAVSEDEDWLKSLQKRFNSQPKQEWSEEDEFFRQQLIVYCDNCVQDSLAAKCVDWLKSLRPQPHWKPSEEQMGWLESAVRLSTNKPRIHGIIISLYEQLKRL